MTEKRSTILVVDDDDEIRKMLNIFLDVADFRVLTSETGKQAIRMSASVKPDLILLDLGLPDIDGKEVISSLRQFSNVPIIVLTARHEDDEAANTLNLGADDFVSKPFSAEILLARINANLRKAAVREVGEPELKNGAIRMDLVRHEVFVSDAKVAFTPKEYDLLRYLLVNRGRMLTHKQILKEVWGPAHVENTQYLRVYISQVREKLDTTPGLSHAIVSESGIGYRMEMLQ
jgi:two-component system, OmpR family, KDP operon response regulator KdpE